MTVTAPLPASVKTDLASRVVRGARRDPDRVLLVGTPGVGKTSLAADFPAPLFICAERGFPSGLDRPRVTPKSWEDVLAFVAWMETDPAAAEFKTLVIDSIDWIEPLLWASVCKRQQPAAWKSIESPGYGKGYVIAAEEFRLLIAAFDRLQTTRDVNVVVVAHSERKRFNNVLGEDYYRWQPKVNDRISSVLVEWADAVLWADFEDLVVPGEGAVRAKGTSTGNRLVHTSHHAGHSAKNRYGLPPVLPLSYSAYAAAREEGFRLATDPGAFDALKAEAATLAERVPADKRATVLAYLASVKDAPTLSRAMDRLRALAGPAVAVTAAPAPTPSAS